MGIDIMKSPFCEWLTELSELADLENIIIEAKYFDGLDHFFATGLSPIDALPRYKELTNRIMAINGLTNFKVSVNAEFLFELQNKQQWINRVPGILPQKTRAGETLIWIDRKGNVFEGGIDFMVAEEQGTYPCRVYRPVSVSTANLKEVSNE